MASQEGQYEAEGYGQRPYDNWERVMLDCEGRVCALATPALLLCVLVVAGLQSVLASLTTNSTHQQ